MQLDRTLMATRGDPVPPWLLEKRRPPLGGHVARAAHGHTEGSRCNRGLLLQMGEALLATSLHEQDARAAARGSRSCQA